MTDIKVYDPLVIIFYRDIDWDIDSVTTSLKNKEAIMEKIQKDKFIEIEWVVLNCSYIIKMEEPKEDKRQLFYSQTREVRGIVKQKLGKTLKDEITRWSYDRLQNFIYRAMDPENYDAQRQIENELDINDLSQAMTPEQKAKALHDLQALKKSFRLKTKEQTENVKL